MERHHKGSRATVSRLSRRGALRDCGGAVEASAEKARIAVAKTDALMRDKLGTNGPWQVARVQTNADGLMRVALKDSSVSESQYQTMVLTACYHLTQAEEDAKEIAFVNVHERTGYAFEAPDRCGEFLKMPTGRVKIPVMAVTHLF